MDTKKNKKRYTAKKKGSIEACLLTWVDIAKLKEAKRKKQEKKQKEKGKGTELKDAAYSLEPEKRDFMILVSLGKSEDEDKDMREYRVRESYRRGILQGLRKLEEMGEIKRVAFQMEMGEVDKQYHLHFAISYKNTKTIPQVIKWFKKYFDLDIAPPKMIKRGKFEEVVSYCQKAKTRVGLYYDSSKKYIYKKFTHKYDKYQEKILRAIRGLNNRQILFVIDTYGGLGKSYLADKEEYKSDKGHPDSEWFVMKVESQVKSGEDIMKSICGQIEAGRDAGKELDDGEVLVFMDIPKATAKTIKTSVLAGVLENIKKGRAFDTRYKYQKTHFNFPKICVFANSELDGITIPSKPVEIKGKVVNEGGERHLIEDRVVIFRVPDTWKSRIVKREVVLKVEEL